MKKHFSIYKYYPLMALFVIAFQFLLIYLFDVGLWMIFCLVIYQIIASGYCFPVLPEFSQNEAVF